MLARHFTLVSPLPPTEVIERLRAATRATSEPRGFFEGFGGEARAYFAGEINEASFDLRRNLPSTRILPHITGQLSPCESGTRIELTLQVRPLTSGFMAIVMALIGLIAWSAMTHGVEIRQQPVFFGGLLVACIAGCKTVLFPDDHTSREALADLLGARSATGH